MPKGSAPRNPKILKTRLMPDGSQQYVRGKSPYARVSTAGKYVSATKNSRAQQLLLNAQYNEMTPSAKKSYSAKKNKEKLSYLASGRAQAARQTKIDAPNAAAKTSHKRALIKSVTKSK